MDWLSTVNVVVSVIVIIATVAESGPLNEYILDYQPLIYDRETVHRNHQRVRSSAADNHLFVKFTAFGRNFQLKLSPAQGIFGPSHRVHTPEKGLHHVDTSYIYSGQVKGEPKSSVHLAVHNGSLEGHIEVPETTYHIEPAAKYIQDPGFHTIIYPETHLDTDPHRVRRRAEMGSCGVNHEKIHEFMERASQVDEPSQARAKRSERRAAEDKPHNIYSEYSNRYSRSADSAPNSRHKRELGASNTCPLHMRADPLLYEYFLKHKHGREITPEQAEEEIVAFFSNHVQAMSTIYKTTMFETYSGGDQNVGLSFAIHRSTVMKSPCTNNADPANDRDAHYCSNTLDVSNYLELTSLDNHDPYCLVYTFTYRDFSEGTLGLAWVAQENSRQVGVCGRNSIFQDGKYKSLNTGIVTIINYGRSVPNRVSQLTFAHEAGHNFGSPHDLGSEECAPFGSSRSDANNGNYIMFPSATSGNKINNDKFSPCSRDNMTRIIQQVVDGTRHQCFEVSGQAFCGNKITEDGEACDCGFGTCDPSTCCTGRTDAGTNDGCVLNPNARCSPDSGPCCNRGDCTFVADTVTCAEESECTMKANCAGDNFKCPDAVHKSNDTYCNSHKKVCNLGECVGSLCSKISWEECFVTTESGGADDELCYLACKNPSGECISSKNTDALAKAENQPFQNLLTEAAKLRQGVDPPTEPIAVDLPGGAPCDNFLGYCDNFKKCQRINSEGPFNQLTNMIFNPVALEKIKDWIVEHWWAVLLMALGVVVFMGVFIKIFGYNTPGEDPKNPRSRSRPAAQANPRNRNQSGNPGRQAGYQSQARAPQQQGQPYHTGMDMASYDRPSYQGGYGQPQQYDRLAPGYSKNKNRI